MDLSFFTTFKNKLNESKLSMNNLKININIQIAWLHISTPNSKQMGKTKKQRNFYALKYKFFL